MTESAENNSWVRFVYNQIFGAHSGNCRPAVVLLLNAIPILCLHAEPAHLLLANRNVVRRIGDEHFK